MQLYRLDRYILSASVGVLASHLFGDKIVKFCNSLLDMLAPVDLNMYYVFYGLIALLTAVAVYLFVTILKQ